MTTLPNGNAHLAVLIDADNADASIIEPLLAEVSKFGVASVKRIYGDWTTPQLGSWKHVLLTHSIQPIQQFAYTARKNSTDSAMIIDAMDLLHTGTFDGFCIVSSDSDFTRLASRLRESGKRVVGFGEEKTPDPFVQACDQFVYTEIFRPAPEGDGSGGGTAGRRRPEGELRQDTRLVNLIRLAIDGASGESGWAGLSAVGNLIVKQAPNFDPRNYGYTKLSDLAEAIGLFTLDRSGGSVLIADSRTVAKQKAPAKRATKRTVNATKKAAPTG
ncbi:NYN domain-containing protein [Intrasporangium calvum]|uniref:NYN domain-containing protein n=1 Tax=Intrasporangium calvum TaxID=53358 RepID=A0ABT5GJJ0_9MICO|nr:NYN domain-containing protein [Intrasporangium calvum]MDC5698413.1 NYN domain-containing protein [Intrasporangium calvum]